jgi:hypothetical protein
MRWQIAGSTGSPNWAALHEPPDIRIETSEFLLDGEKGAGVGCRTLYLESIANDSWIGEELPFLALIITRNQDGIKMIERLAIVLPFP